MGAASSRSLPFVLRAGGKLALDVAATEPRPPEKADLECFDPGSGHPVVPIVVVVCPVAGRPEVAVARQRGCSYTGRAGGPNETAIPTCANDAVDVTSTTSASRKERRERIIRIVLPLARSPFACPVLLSLLRGLRGLTGRFPEETTDLPKLG